jgi:hypothetical protein
MWLAGNKRREAWWLALAAQGLWAWYAVTIEAWGLLPMSAALTAIYARNAWKWSGSSYIIPPLTSKALDQMKRKPPAQEKPQ